MKTRAQKSATLPDKMHRHTIRKGENPVLCKCGGCLFVFVRPEFAIVFDSKMAGHDAPAGTMLFRCVTCGKSELAT